MATQKQIVANRQNSMRSTGPKTEGDTEKSSNSAIKCGLTAITIPGENPEEVDAFRSALVGDLAPQSALEEIIVEKIVADAWRFRRIPQFEAALYHYEEKQIRIQAVKNEMGEYREFSLGQVIARIVGEVRPEAREANQAAEARLKEVQAETVPSITRLAWVLQTEWDTFSNLERYETALFRSFAKALRELQRLQARRAGERMPAPAILDVDLDLEGAPATTHE
jgi:hypothetical protein